MTDDQTVILINGILIKRSPPSLSTGQDFSFSTTLFLLLVFFYYFKKYKSFLIGTRLQSPGKLPVQIAMMYVYNGSL